MNYRNRAPFSVWLLTDAQNKHAVVIATDGEAARQLLDSQWKVATCQEIVGARAYRTPRILAVEKSCNES